MDVLSGKSSRDLDYSCDIKVDEAFETTVHELRDYFGFFKLARACESILRFYSYDGSTNYLKLKTGERAQHFLQSDPGLQHIANEFTPEMFAVEGIEVLGTPIGTENYIKNFVALNCVKIMRDIEKLEPLTEPY